jgi:uncharacterized protein YqgV (UPF0045/DUF77 family)
MIVAFSVAPSSDESGSVSAAVARAVRVVADSGLPYELNAMFTLVEGEWEEVMEVVRCAVEAASAGASRTSLVLTPTHCLGVGNDEICRFRHTDRDQVGQWRTLRSQLVGLPTFRIPTKG